MAILDRSRSVGAKAFIVGVIVVLLLIPLTMLRGLVNERSGLRTAAYSPDPEVVRRWRQAHPDEHLLWHQARVQLPLWQTREVRGVEGVYAGQPLRFVPATASESRGIEAALTWTEAPSARVDFELHLLLAGSKGLSLLSLGSTTRATMTGNWPHPSFSGAFAPTRYQIDSHKFSAEWRVLELNRSYGNACARRSGRERLAGVRNGRRHLSVGRHLSTRRARHQVRARLHRAHVPHVLRLGAGERCSAASAPIPAAGTGAERVPPAAHCTDGARVVWSCVYGRCCSARAAARVLHSKCATRRSAKVSLSRPPSARLMGSCMGWSLRRTTPC